MKKLICLILAVMILCCGCGLEPQIAEYHEWISPDGVHYWSGHYKMAPRYDNNGNLVIDEVQND